VTLPVGTNSARERIIRDFEIRHQELKVKTRRRGAEVGVSPHERDFTVSPWHGPLEPILNSQRNLATGKHGAVTR
jgi:hypothetical protein